SASFAALGVGLATGVPAVLLCTSGTASAHFHAAVVEAHQSAVPMIVCTADRPPELRDVGAPQTIEQTMLYGSAVRWFHDPGVADPAATHTWRSLAAHAFASATHGWPGPVHLNLPFREPLVGTAGALLARNGTGRVTLSGAAALDDVAVRQVARLLGGRRGIIVAGRGGGTAGTVHALAVALGWPVLADARSGMRHVCDVAVAAADHVLRAAAFAGSHRPEVIVRLGEPPASKVVAQWLTGSGAVQIHVSAVPSWSDADGLVAHRIVADVDATLAALTSALDAPGRDADEWLADWMSAEHDAQEHITSALSAAALTEPTVCRMIGSLLPSGSHLVVSSSMPIRDVEWFGTIAEGVTVHSNRGANGIDGVIATATGVAVATAAPTAVVIGDVAFVHDSSSLTALARREVDLRIVVIDNDGGGIFSFLPQASTLPHDRFEQLFGTPHGTDVAALAAAHGLPVAVVTTRDELATAASAPGPRVIVFRSDRTANVAVHERLNRGT
ncbi:MAG TPA: 2-succinyl-5-enolpyruvyl-6-hydroxy-3-cyclohexene-1-carboxylic-acid synthase, partial [Ilumatobacteraceae bacterium]